MAKKQVFFEQKSDADHSAANMGKGYRVFAMYGKPEQRWFVGTYRQYIRLRHKRPGWNHCKVCNDRTMNKDHCYRCREHLDYPYANRKMKWLKLREGK